MPEYELEQAFETVNLQRRGAIAKIELNRPETLNAWNKQFGLDLLDAVRRVGADDSVRAVVIQGAGKGFSSGADLKAGFEPAANGRPDVGTALRERYHPIITGVREIPKPVVAAVHGPAVGIGLSLALASDLIVAAESAYFLLAFVNIGLVPDGGSSVFVPARVGFTRAIEMATLGERVPAPQALEWGLINRVHPDDAFPAEVEALMDAPGRRAHRLLRRDQAPAQRPACMQGWRSSSSSRPGSRRRWPPPTISWKASQRSSRSARRAFARSDDVAKACNPPARTASLECRPLWASAAVFANAIGPETGGSPNADNTHTLWVIVLIIALIVLVGVEGLLLYTVIRFRARKHRVAAQIHGNTRLEIGWTIAAGVIVIALTVVAFASLPGIQNPQKSGAQVSLAGAQVASINPPKVPGGRQLDIAVNGQQYVWRYTYPDGHSYSYTEMVVPANQTVVLKITGQDVAHSWWIPKLGGKFDAIPGYNNYTWFKASKVGGRLPRPVRRALRSQPREHARRRAGRDPDRVQGLAGVQEGADQRRQQGVGRGRAAAVPPPRPPRQALARP